MKKLALALSLALLFGAVTVNAQGKQDVKKATTTTQVATAKPGDKPASVTPAKSGAPATKKSAVKPAATAATTPAKKVEAPVKK
jgi:hypothetical protein